MWAQQCVTAPQCLSWADCWSQGHEARAGSSQAPVGSPVAHHTRRMPATCFLTDLCHEQVQEYSPALVLESLFPGCEWRGLSHLSDHLFGNTKSGTISHAFLLARGAGREPAALAREMGAEDLLGWEGWGALCSGNHGFLMCETTGRSQELGCRSGQTGNWVAGGRQTQELSKVFQGWCSFPGQPHCWPWASGSLVEENLCLCWGLGVVWSTPAREGLSFSAAREELGIYVQPADFSPTSLSMHCEALAPSLSVPRNVCMQVTSSGFKCLPSTLDKNRTFL